MATDRKSDEILLNALADGELSPAEQAAAAARLRNDKEFARAYATLTKLKAAVAEDMDADDLPPIRAAMSRPPRRWIAYGIAASLALIFGAAALSLLPPRTTMPARSSADIAGAPIPVTFAGDPVIPDFSSAGLQLSRTVVRTSAGMQSLVATYLGPRGCRLELWISNARVPDASPDGTRRKSWQVDGLVYELVAFGMPAARFSKVAAFAERETRATRLPDDGEPLIQARVPRPPCIT